MNRAFIAFLLLLLLMTVAMGQGGRRGRSSIYDVNTVETIVGEVISVEQQTGRNGFRGVHLMVKTDKEIIPVHLGPMSFLETKKIKFATQDKVEIKGSRITFQGRPAIVAAEVKRSDQVLKLRDENGFPLWRGGNRP